MILLAVVASEDVEFFIEQCGGVVLYLWRLNALIVSRASLTICVIIGRIGQVLEEASESSVSGRNLILEFVAFAHQDPLQPLRRLLARRRYG